METQDQAGSGSSESPVTPDSRTPAPAIPESSVNLNLELRTSTSESEVNLTATTSTSVIAELGLDTPADPEHTADSSSTMSSTPAPAIAEPAAASLSGAIAQSILDPVSHFSASEGNAAPTETTSPPELSPAEQTEQIIGTSTTFLATSEPGGTGASANPEIPLDSAESEARISIALTERRNELHELARLKQEVVQLQEQNTRLEAENGYLQDELLDSEHTIVHLLEVIEISNRGKSPVILPNEIYRMIFLRVVPPHSFLDTSLCGGPTSAWNNAIQSMINIIMVCKRWAEIGMEQLYECVVFRRLGQLFAFARTLELHPELGKLVKRIEIRCYVQKHCMSAYAGAIKSVLDCCAPLDHITFDPLLPSWPAFCGSAIRRTGTTLQDHETCTRESLEIIPLNVTHLDLGRSVPLELLGAQLPSFQHLWSLTLQLPHVAGDFSEDDPPSVPIVKMGHLHHLSLDVGRSSLYSFKKIYAEWSMPLLRQLRIQCHDDSFLAVFCSKFLGKHGGLLQYLHVHPCCLHHPRDVIYAGLSIACPVLEHLVLHPGAVLPPMHPTLALVDIWTAKFSAHIDRVADLRGCLQQRDAYPCLRRIRTLDCGLPPNIDWPLLFPPDENFGNLPLEAEYEYPYLHIQVNMDGIFRLDLPPWVDEEGAEGQDEEIDSDDDYSPPSESQSDDHSSDLSWISDVDEGDGNLENMDRQEILEIFQESLNG